MSNVLTVKDLKVHLQVGEFHLDDPLLDDVWGLLDQKPDLYSFILINPEGDPVEMTGARLRALRDGGRTLVKKGHLLASITRAFTAISATVGTNLIYARSMQLGDTRSIAIGAHTRKIRSLFGKPLKKPRTIEIGAHSQKRALPPRPFIGLSADDETEIFYILREFLAGKGLTA